MANWFISSFHLKYILCEIKMYMACRKAIRFSIWKKYNGGGSSMCPLTDWGNLLHRWKLREGACKNVVLMEGAGLSAAAAHPSWLWAVYSSSAEKEPWPQFFGTPPPFPIRSLLASDLGSGCELQCLTLHRDCRKDPYLGARVGGRALPCPGEARRQGPMAEECLFSHLPGSQGRE